MVQCLAFVLLQEVKYRNCLNIQQGEFKIGKSAGRKIAKGGVVVTGMF